MAKIEKYRDKVLKFSKVMTAQEVNEWNELMQKPDVKESQLKKFVAKLCLKY